MCLGHCKTPFHCAFDTTKLSKSNKKLKLKKTQAKKNRETTSNKKLSVALIAVKKQEEDAKEQDAKFYNDLLKRTGLDMAVTLENLN